MSRSVVPDKIIREVSVLKAMHTAMKGSSFENTLYQEGVLSAAKSIENLSSGIVAAINTGNEIVEQMGEKCPPSLKNFITGINGSLVGILNGTCDLIEVDKYLKDSNG